MAEVWLLTLQIAMLAFVISTATAAAITLIRVVLRKVTRAGKGEDK